MPCKVCCVGLRLRWAKRNKNVNNLKKFEVRIYEEVPHKLTVPTENRTSTMASAVMTIGSAPYITKESERARQALLERDSAYNRRKAVNNVPFADYGPLQPI